jgi:hypothetical protein
MKFINYNTVCALRTISPAGLASHAVAEASAQAQRGQGVDKSEFFYSTICPPGNGLRAIIHNSSFIIHNFLSGSCSVFCNHWECGRFFP